MLRLGVVGRLPYLHSLICRALCSCTLPHSCSRMNYIRVICPQYHGGVKQRHRECVGCDERCKLAIQFKGWPDPEMTTYPARSGRTGKQMQSENRSSQLQSKTLGFISFGGLMA